MKDVLAYNIFAGLHNLNLVGKAEKLVNEFLDEDNNSIIYARNPDGSYLKLQKGVKLMSATGLGIEVI